MTTTQTNNKTKMATASKIMRKMKVLVAEIKAKTEEVLRSEVELALCIFYWADTMIAAGKIKSYDSVSGVLADTIGLSKRRCASLLYHGQFLVEEGLEKDVQSLSVARALRNARNAAAKADYLKALDMVKNGGRAIDIVRFVNNAKIGSGDDIRQRLVRYGKRGHATAAMLKMEMMAVITLARKVYKTPDMSLALCDGITAEVLMEVHEGLPMRRRANTKSGIYAKVREIEDLSS